MAAWQRYLWQKHLWKRHLWKRHLWKKLADGKKNRRVSCGLGFGSILGSGFLLMAPVATAGFPEDAGVSPRRSPLAQVPYPAPDIAVSEELTSEAAISEETLPATKPGTVFIEGEPMEINLHLFTAPEMPLYTYYPEGMIAESTCYEESCSIIFTGFEDLARVAFFFPSAMTDLAEMEAMVMGPTGLVYENGWQITGEYDEARYLPYPWVKKMLTFVDPVNSALGSFYLGEANGRLFMVTVVFPAEFGDGFVPLANVIFENLQVQSIESLNEDLE